MNNPVKELKEKDKEIQLIAHTLAILGWDQETFLPSRAVEERAEQMSLLEGLIHDRITADRNAELFAAIGIDVTTPANEQAAISSLDETDKNFVREFHKAYTRRIKLPKSLVMELARETSLGQARWAEARTASDFSLFSPNLDRLIRLVKEKADCIGHDGDRYDPLLDEFEPWMKNSEVAAIFSALAPKLTDLVHRFTDAAKTRPKHEIPGDFDIALQEAVSKRIMTMMGFDFNRGRLDTSTHPFTTTLGFADVRITTRYNTGNLLTNIYSTVHETGHALYEQGFSREIERTLLATGTSMGIHESQSRLWENIIGRSRGFTKRLLGLLRDAFPGRLDGITDDVFYNSIVNRVEPSFIRTESDEVTYNLHIILRYNLENRLVRGELSIADLPAAWREESKKLLGIDPPTDALGVLQDIHWSMGAIGYFPTYALGNLYAAQFHAAMCAEIAAADIANGTFDDDTLAAVLTWLREKIHKHGCTLPAHDLCKAVTGRPLDPSHFITYLKTKFGEIYGIQ